MTIVCKLKLSLSLKVIAIFFLNSILFKKVNAQEMDTLQRKLLEETVITAQYQPQSLRASVFKINVLDQKRINAKAITNAQQVLSGELGIRFDNDMALGTADISLMGMKGRNIKILLDGVPMLDRGDSRESLNQINAAQIEKIEIVEGPMSIMYGSDALAGVINIITKSPVNNSLQIHAQVGEESAGKEYKPFLAKGLHTQQVSASWDDGKFNMLASVLHYDFGGFGGDNYNRNHSWKPKEQLLPSIRFGYKGKSWDALYRNDFLLETITEKAPINLGYRAANRFYVTNRMAHQFQFNKKWGKRLFFNNSLGLTDYKRYTKTDLLDYRNQTITPGIQAGQQDTAKFLAFNFRTSLLYLANKKLSFQPGIDISYDKANGDRILGSPEITNLAAFVTMEYKISNKLNLRPGLRVNKNSLYEAPPVLPSFNILYSLNDNVSIRGSYAQGFRAPALRELYFNFVDANHNLIGNENLKAETSHSFNVSAAYRKLLSQSRIYSTELSFFYNRFHQLIDIALDANDPLNQRYTMFNNEKYRTSGISLANRFVTQKVEWRIGGLLLGQYNSIVDNPQLKNDYNAILWSPEFNIEMMYSILATNTKINIFYKYTGKRISYSNQLLENDEMIVTTGNRAAYNIMDVNVQQQITPNFKLVLGARNLFNVTTIANSATGGGVHGGSSSNLPFSYGRSYFASINFNFIKDYKKQ